MSIIHYVNVIHTSADRRTRRHLARRDEVLAAALRLVEDEGLAALTVARIAKRLDAAVGALYRYFPGKGAVLVALQARAIGELEQEVHAEVERAEARLRSRPPRGRREGLLRLLLAALRPLLDGHRRKPARHRLIDELLSNPEPVLSPAELAEVNAALAPLILAVRHRLDACTAASALSPGDGPLRTRVLWAALHGVDHFRKRDRGEPLTLRTAAVGAALVRALLIGFGARPADLDAALAVEGSR